MVVHLVVNRESDSTKKCVFRVNNAYDHPICNDNLLCNWHGVDKTVYLCLCNDCPHLNNALARMCMAGWLRPNLLVQHFCSLSQFNVWWDSSLRAWASQGWCPSWCSQAWLTVCCRAKRKRKRERERGGGGQADRQTDRQCALCINRHIWLNSYHYNGGV